MAGMENLFILPSFYSAVLAVLVAAPLYILTLWLRRKYKPWQDRTRSLAQMGRQSDSNSQNYGKQSITSNDKSTDYRQGT